MGKLNQMKQNSLLFYLFLFQVTISQDFELSGYFKLMPSLTVQNTSDIKKFWDLNNNNRLKAKLYFSEKIQLTLENKVFGAYGDIKRTNTNIIDQLKPVDEYLDLTTTLFNSNNYFLLNRVDRFFFKYIEENFEITFGRQRIAWGTSWAWNPIDLFNPSSPLDFDNEEKNGADALRLQYFLNYNSSIDLVYKHAEDKNHRNVALKYLNSISEYDLHILIGYQRDYPYFGFAWAGDIQGAGFRGELVYHNSQEKFIFLENNLFQYSNKSYVVANLSFDYTFESSFYIHSEFLYNDIAEKRSEFLNIYLNSLSQSRFSVFYEIAYQVADLARANVIFIDNPDRNQFSILGVYSNSLFQNTDLSFIILYSKPNFAVENLSLFCRMKYSF